MPPKPRIGIDAHTIDGIYQGSRTHAIEIFSRVVRSAPDIDFFLFASNRQKVLDASDAFGLPNATIVSMPERSGTQRLLGQLPAFARKLELDLLHCQYIVPPFCPCPTAVTIHDILYESNPEFYSRVFVLRSRLFIRLSARRSSLVFTVSEFSRQQIVTRYGLPAGQVTTIHNGVNYQAFHPLRAPDPELEALNLQSGNYLLMVGRLEPRKNHLNLLKAYQQLPQPRPRLVIVGQRDFGYDAILEQVNALKDDVLLLEKVHDRLLPILYRNAMIFVYPSLAEGFGMPLLEAMASAVPVITSDNTALREVAGNAALVVDPRSPESISAAMQTALNRPDLRKDLAERGVRRAAEYDWDSSAERVLARYRNTTLEPAAKAARVHQDAGHSQELVATHHDNEKL